MERKVIVGLGNPEPEFFRTRHNPDFDLLKRMFAAGLFKNVDETRHNAGFVVLNALGASNWRYDSNLRCRLASLDFADCSLTLVQPMNGMNTSGVAVKAVLAQLGLSKAELLVVYDDIALPMGKLRFQQAGSAGGHNGVKSVIEELGGAEFDRLKVAVGPVPKGARILDFVLGSLPGELKASYAAVVSHAAKACRLWAAEGVQLAMTKYNGMEVGAP